MKETRRYCGKCGKVFDIALQLSPLNKRGDKLKSPCCGNIYNNEILCGYYGDCPIGENNQDCGSNCIKYKAV